FSAKQADLSAGANITDIGLYIQNNRPNNVSIVSAGGDIIAYDPQSPLQRQAQSGNTLNLSVPLQSGDIQISGPGTLEVLAGGNVDLGNGANNSDGTGVGITSIANARNPSLPSQGADLVVGAGVKLPMGLSSPDGLALQNFTTTLLAGAQGATYLSVLSDAMTYSGAPLPGNISAASFAPGSTDLSQEERANLELQLFYLVLTETGINHNKVGKPEYGSYAQGEKAISTIFGNASAHANVSTWARDIATKSGGNINILIPSGALTLQTQSAGTPPLAPPGIVTDAGGSINIYSRDDISIGISRIFTLRGGDILIWSDKGNIAAGSSAKTVQSAAPTQVLIDPQSGNVQTDLAGLGTGGGIGVLATVAGVLPGNVNLIAPSGVIDAGDAGIRSSGNLNLAATKVLNADNIAASGSTSGAPPAAPPPAAPNVSGATAASSASAANNSAAQGAAQKNTTDTTEPPPSVISIDILGYGMGGKDQGATTSSESVAPPQASL
ncbi:MAG: filamentous hemagglutinin family protein, partial [Verrucomicrobiota bacterium]